MALVFPMCSVDGARLKGVPVLGVKIDTEDSNALSI